MPSAVRWWLCQVVTSLPNSRTCPALDGKIPVIRLNSVVLPAPFGPRTALGSPVMILTVTPRTACRPPKLFDSPFNSRTGVWPLAVVSALTFSFLCVRGKRPGPRREAPVVAMLVAELAGRIIAAVDRRCQELGLLELAELIDVRIGLDDGVPELCVGIAEHLHLRDFLDVDVLHRVAHLVERDRSTRGVDLDRRQQLEEL